MGLSKGRMLAALPVCEEPLTLRRWTMADTYARAAWPSYPPEYTDFNFALAGASQEELDRHFLARDRDPGRVPLAVDHADQPVISYFALHETGWAERTVGNVGFRLHPDWCNRGYGPRILRLAAGWCGDCGVRSIRLDVAAPNIRAVRCYEKAGMVKVSEFWQPAPGLASIDIADRKHDALRPHFRIQDGVPHVRFWWMELTTAQGQKGQPALPDRQ